MATHECIPAEITSNAEAQRTIPVWESTRDRARRVKGQRTYDELISMLLNRYEAELNDN